MEELKNKDEMNILKPFLRSLIVSVMALTACDHPKKMNWISRQDRTTNTNLEKAEVLPYFNMKEAKAEYALPFVKRRMY
jgi:hypothetical protein